MKRSLIIMMFIVALFIILLVIILWPQSTFQMYMVIAESSEPYPEEYIPISEWDLLQMPSLITAFDNPGVVYNITKDEWQEIYDFLEATKGVMEFYGDFFFVRLLRK